jgi:hypothetical protein
MKGRKILMYAHKIPIHLETEDKFLWHLTLRQCVVLTVGCTIAYTSFINMLATIPNPTFGLFAGTLVALLVMICAVALAFVNIFGRGLDEWGLVLLLYAAQPRLYLWRFARPDAFERLNQCERERQIATRESEDDAW